MKFVYVGIMVLLLGLAFLVGRDNAPSTKRVVVHDSKPTTGCNLPIKVGDYGYIKYGDCGGLRAKVVGKLDNGIDCAYSTYIKPKKQNNYYRAEEVYKDVNADNLAPINGEMVS